MREVILRTLWIGNSHEARDVKAVFELGLKAIVDLAMEEPPILLPRELVYCRFPLVDGEGNTPALVKAAIETTSNLIQGGVPTLVACSDGMSRSPAIVAAALAETDGTSIEEALKTVTRVGPHDVSVTFWAEVQAASGR